MMKNLRMSYFTLVATVVVSVFCMANPVMSACPDQLIAYWKLNETAGSTYADFTGNNDGTGNADPSPATGILNGAQEFDGSTMGIDVAASHNFNWLGTESFSIEAWVQTDGTAPGSIQVIVGRRDVGLNMQVWVGMTATGTPAYVLRDAAGNLDNKSTGVGAINLSNGAWHHIVLTRNGTTGENSLYVDGALQGTDDTVAFSGAFSSSTAPLNIGYYAGSDHFDGLIDEVAIYDRALGLTEVQNNYSAGMPVTDICDGAAYNIDPFPPDTISLWALDEAGGSDYVDMFGNNDGTGNADPSPATGTVNGAQEFDGSTTGIDVAASHTFNWLNTASFSIEAWVQTDGSVPGGIQVIVGRRDAGTNMQVWVGMTAAGTPAYVLRDTATNIDNQSAGIGAINLSDGAWHHIVLTRNGTTGENSLYVDGALQGTDDTVAFTGTFSSSSAPLTIGYFGTGSRLDGLIDEVAIYDQAMPLSEIQDHYNAGLAGNSVTSLRVTTPPAPTPGPTPTPTGGGGGGGGCFISSLF